MAFRRCASLLLPLVVCLLAVTPVRAQEPGPSQTPPQAPAPAAPPASAPAPAAPTGTAPQTPTAPEPSSPGGGTTGTGTEGEPITPQEGPRFLSHLDIYFPEGDMDLRINRLINKTFFEGQVKYNFISGDISAFLRYRYYGLNRTTQLTFFDSIAFDRIDQDVTADFDRVRGTLLLMEWPHDYNNRTFFLAELDRISSNRGPAVGGGRFLVRQDQTNAFLRLGYQLGTPDEGRSSAIAGETRARTERLFSAFREFGPGASTLTSALSWGLPYAGADFNYLKFEFEALKRFDITHRSFLVGRLHGGSFLHVAKAEPSTLPPQPEGIDFFAVPRSEAFNIDGRENLKGVKDNTRGTDAIFTTWEYFFPAFLGKDHHLLRMDWDNWYWVLYGGYGTVGLSHAVLTDFSTYIPDVGIGFESSFWLYKYRFFISGIVAQALKGNSGLQARVSLKSYR